jgi:diguanylate cyclase (GGDEF)-like protein
MHHLVMVIHEQDTAVTDLQRPVLVEPQGARDCLVLIYRGYGISVGTRFELDRPVFRIGRGTGNDLALEEENVSRSHARIEARGDRWILMDVGSTNGTMLNDRRLVGYGELRLGDRIKIGSHIFKFLAGNDIEAAFHEEIYATTVTDSLTNLRSRRSFDEEFRKEFARARRHQLPTSLALLDIDHFKGINDGFGHLAGDAVLAGIAGVIRGHARSDDTAARYGGEELALLTPLTDLGNALCLAERIRRAIAAHVTEFEDQLIATTVSIGCAELDASDREPEDLIRRCDQRLYDAKRAGRNRVAG